MIRRYTTIFFAVLILSIGLIEPLSRPSFADVIDERKRGIENPPPFGHVSTLHTLVCQMVTTAPFYVAAWQSPSFYFDIANDASARFPALYLTIATTLIFASVAIWKIFFAVQDAATIAAGGPIAFLIMQAIRILQFFAASSVLLANCPPRIIIADLPSSFVGDLEVEPQVHPITGRVYPVVTGASTIHDNPVIQTEMVPGHADFLNTPVPPFACNVEIKIDKNLLRNPPLSIPPLDPAVQFGDLQPYSVDYPPSFELIFDRLVRWETDISEIVGDENINTVHDTFIFKVGSYKISFVVAVPEIPLTNLVQLQLDVLEEIRPNLVAEDRTFQSVFPQGALAGVIENSIITNALNDPDTRDDCTPNDELELTTNFRGIPELSVNSSFLPIGEYDVTLTLRDFSGNEDSKTIKITVEDTIPPDILQPDDLGVSVDPGSGGIDGFTLLNGGHPNPDDEALLTPPLTFDLATLQPDIECIVNNSQSTDLDCESAFFPSGEISTVTWIATDLVGNSQDIMQQVNVKQRGANNPPQAISQLVKVAQGIPKEIIVKGTDPDFDQLSFFITNNPILGGFVEPLDPIFQTRFSIAGTISELKSFQLRDESVSNKGNFLVTIADPLQQRLVIFNEGEGTIEANLDLSSLGIIPNVNTGPLGTTEGPFGGIIADFVNKKLYRYDTSFRAISVGPALSLPTNIFGCPPGTAEGVATERCFLLGPPCPDNFTATGVDGVNTCILLFPDPRTGSPCPDGFSKVNVVATVCVKPKVPLTAINQNPKDMVFRDPGNDNPDNLELFILDQIDSNNAQIVKLDVTESGNLQINSQRVIPLNGFGTLDAITLCGDFCAFESNTFLIAGWEQNKVFSIEITGNTATVLQTFDLSSLLESTPQPPEQVGDTCPDGSGFVGSNKCALVAPCPAGMVTVIQIDLGPVRIPFSVPTARDGNACLKQGTAPTCPAPTTAESRISQIGPIFLCTSKGEPIFEDRPDIPPAILEPAGILASKNNLDFTADHKFFISDTKTLEIISVNLDTLEIFPFDVGASFVNILGIDSDPSGNLYMFDLKHFLKFNIAGRLLAVSETDIFRDISVKDFFLDSSGNLNVLFDDQSSQGFDYQKFDSNLNGVALEDEVFDQEAKKIAGNSVETLVPRLQCPDGTGPSIGLVAECLVDAPCPAGMQTELQYVFDLGFPFGEIPFSVSISTSSLTQACLSKTVPNCPQPTSPFQINVVTIAGIIPVFACETDGVLQDVLVFVDKIFAMGQFGEIKEYTSDLAFVNIVVPKSLGGIDMDLDSNGNLFVLSQNKVHKFNDAAGPNPSSSFNLKENSAGPDSRIVLDDNGNVYVTFPVTFPGAIPRIDKYSNNGDFLAFAVPDGTPGDFDSFLQKGDFTNVQDITISQDVIFVAENEPLKRVHFFDSGPFTIIDSNSASVTYSSSILGSDQFAFKVFDLFVDSAPANVDVEVIIDVTPPDIALSPEADDFIPELTPISNLVFNIENQQSQMINEIEHFVLAHQIISQYKELYQTTLGDSFPDKMVPYLKEKAMKVAMLNTNYKEQQSSQVLDQSKIAYPVLWKYNSQNLVQTIDYYGISNNLVSEPTFVQQVSSCDLPDITLEGDTVGGISKENPTIAALLSFIVATDEIDPNPIITNNIPNIIPVGEHTFDVTATDESNNSATCPWNITVQDTTPPEFSAPDDVVKPVEAEKTIVSPDELGSPVVSDIVDDSVLVENDAPASGFPVRDTTVTWTATDASGNSAAVTQLVTIEDTTPPEITNVPEDSVIEAINGFGNVINYDLPVASDLGGLMEDIECSMPSGSELPIGLTLILCSAVDNAFLTTFEMFSVTVVSSDDDGDGITNIVDPNAAISNEFNDVSLGGITSGVIVTSGDQTVHVIDGDTVQNGVIIMSESGGLGINEDLDCKDSAGEIQRGFPDDGLEDLCYDAEGNPNADVTEIFDEDPIDGIDNDGDGLIDEDFGVAVGPIPAVVSACENSALITLGEGDAVKVTCGSITIEAVSGTVEISFSGGATTTLDPGESMTFDADTLSVTAGPNTDAIIKVGDQEIPIESGQTIQLDGESTPTITPAEAIQLLIDDVDALVESGKLDSRTARALQWLLGAALTLEEGEDHDGAVSKLQSFNSRLNLFVGRGMVSSDIGQPLMDSAQVIIESDPGVGIISPG